MGSRIVGDFVYRGAVTFLNALLNSGCVSDDQVAANAAIAASKLEHSHRHTYAQESATTAAAEDRVMHVVDGTAGTIQLFEAGAVVANIGNATVTVDLLKDGASVLTSAISLTSSEAAYETVIGVIDTNTLVDGDVLEVSVTVSAGTGTLATGVFVSLDVDEDAI